MPKIIVIAISFLAVFSSLMPFIYLMNPIMLIIPIVKVKNPIRIEAKSDVSVFSS